MGTFKKVKFGLLFLPLTAFLVVLGSGCSSNQATNGAAPPAPDAGTDAVPQAAVEQTSPDANLPPPVLAAENAPSTPAPTLMGENSEPAPVLAAENSANSPPPPQLTSENSPAAPLPTELAPAPADNSAQAAVAEAPPAPVAEAPVSAPPPPAELKSDPATERTPAHAPMAAAASDDSSEAYVVRPGDTLMKIAYENYGDLHKWREIYEANKGKIHDPNAVPPGTQLQLDPSQRKTIAHNGSQYRIKGGDTLGSISMDVYGKKEKWKRLWKNNKQLIPDPNKIYAGFYLYYTLTAQERKEFKARKGVEPDAPDVSARTISSEGN